MVFFISLICLLIGLTACTVCESKLEFFNIIHRLGNGLLEHQLQTSNPSRKLGTTPLYYVCTSTGGILYQDDLQSDNPDQKIITHFMSSEDAVRYLEEVSQSSPGDFRVKAVTMEKIVNQIQGKKQSRKIGRHKVDVIQCIQPSSRQVNNALKVDKKAIKEGSIPMFTSNSMAIKRANGKTIIPYYFNYEDLRDDWSKLIANDRMLSKTKRAPKVTVRDFTDVMCLSKGINVNTIPELKASKALKLSSEESTLIPGIVPPRREIEWMKDFSNHRIGLNNEFRKAKNL